MKAFYGARFSPHMTRTPEGFLICHSVPICRTGTQEYLPKEIGDDEDDGGLVEVHRDESEVFKPAAIASFEGKPVTDDHPPVGVDSSNFASYTKGTVQNVHRGSGEDADKLVCDLVIYDANLIAKIDAGKREISCGYDCEYIKDGEKTYRQANIIGNHVAVVDDGRAGHSVAIRDAKPKGGKKMPRPARPAGNILQRMFARFAQDAEPEDIRAAARAVDEAEAAQNGQQQPPREEHEETTHDADYAVVMDAVNALNERINALQSAHDEEPEEEEGDHEIQSLDSLEEELENGQPQPQQKPPTEDSDEDSVTVPPEQLEDHPQEDEDVPAEKQEPKQPLQPQADRRVCDTALSMVRAMKPYIAMMPPRQRKHAADALSAAARKAMDVRDTQPLNGGYGALTRRKAADAAAKMADARAFGENCRKRNPHYQHKEEK